MRRRRSAPVVLATLVSLIALGTTGCGGRNEAFRVGLLVDCTGPFGGFHDGLLASAELPLLERGGRLVEKPGGAVAEVTVAGRSVQLVEGCSEVGVYSRLIAEARRLVEQEHVDALVGPFGSTDGIVLRDYLRRHLNVTALLAASFAQAATLRRPSPNVFRFTPDSAQASAGLGSYAYSALGWRTAALVEDGFSTSWEGAAGFVAEFCSLGGSVVDRIQAPLDQAARAAALLPKRADGTVVLLSGFANPLGLFRALARRGPLPQTMLTWRATISDPSLLKAAAPALSGVVMASDVPGDASARWRAYEKSFGQRFPDQPVAFAAGLGLYFYAAVDALLQALDEVHGDTPDGQRRLRKALSRLTLEAPEGRVSLDANRQAIAPNYLVRIGVGAQGRPALHTVKVVPNVEQTFSGYLSAAPEPSATKPACRSGPVPTWAR